MEPLQIQRNHKLTKKYCVYGLHYPESRACFYIGKGVEGRWNHHFKEASCNRSDNQIKIDVINEIESSGNKVIVSLFHEFDSEDDALAYESYLIDKYDGLTNIVGNKTRVRQIRLFTVCRNIINCIGKPEDSMQDLLKLEPLAILDEHKEMIKRFKKLLQNQNFVNKVWVSVNG